MFAVVMQHVDEGKSLEQLPAIWPDFINLASFAVPFFLATSFYLAVDKLIAQPRSNFPIKKRILRLLIPYCSWTALYVFYKIARYTLLNKGSTLQNFLSDPISIIFMGGAGLHLYFLPLLMVGTLVIKPLSGKVIA
ncbi:MAG: acyltransferase family protein, partial [Cyanobacteria bacterium J06555_13]